MDVCRAMEALQERGAKTVVITSTQLSSADDENHLRLYCSDSQRSKHRFVFPRIPLDFVGTGDLFAALLLAHFHR